MKKIFGYFLFFSPFIVLACFMVAIIGWLGTLFVFAAAAVSVSVMTAGAALVDSYDRYGR